MKNGPYFSILGCIKVGLSSIVLLFFGLLPCHGEWGGDGDSVLGVEEIESVLPVFDGVWFRAEGEAENFAPLRVLLSRSRYWEQDGHIDVVIRLSGEGELSGAQVSGHFVTAGGEDVGLFSLLPPGRAFIVYLRIPDAVRESGGGELVVELVDGDRRLALESRPFRVERYDEPVDRVGRVPIVVGNPGGVVMDGLPVSVGVPFPRGVLWDLASLRLVDGCGEELSLQVAERARWSKYGSIKWVLCDFVVALAGEPVEVYLEYGGVAEERDADSQWHMGAEVGVGFPGVAGETIRVTGAGVEWLDGGGGEAVALLGLPGLSGAFVEHEDGRVYRPDPQVLFEVEESGAETVVVRRQGWYREVGGNDRFCRFVTRFVLYRGSPLMRVFHTWIFTGDGNRDRIANMGWGFPLGAVGGEVEFLTDFGPLGRWEKGDSLLQYDYEHFLLSGATGEEDYAGGRAPGVVRLGGGGGGDLYFGVKDFWQNYPSELEMGDGVFWFHNWPRRNLAARHTFAKELIAERGVAAASSSAARYALEDPEKLSRSEWLLNVIQSRHAHEGEMLDFRLPDVYNEDPIWEDATSGQPHWDRGDVDTVNAQGVSRTEEFWFLSDSGGDVDNVRRILEGLNDESFRAVVDPWWLALSGAFYEFLPQDPLQFPREEALYETVALLPSRVAERLGIYGMWIYGDVPGWNPRLEIKEPVLYRAYRRHHLGWPYPWMPYIRSGDPRFFKWAESSTRRMIDTAWNHHISADVDRRVGPERHRRHGMVGIGPFPWGTGSSVAHFTRSTGTKVDYLLEYWYLTGYTPAWQRVRAWMEEMKVEEPGIAERDAFNYFTRASNSMLRACLESWEATFDPWFLVAAHALSEGHLHGRSNEHADGNYGGRGWDTGDREFLRFTGCDTYRDFYLNRHAARATSERVWSNWNRRHPQWQIKSYAWKLTEDPFYLRRAVHAVDQSLAIADFWNPYRHEVRTEEREPWQLGMWEGNSFGGHFTFFTAYFLRWFPLALWAIDTAGERPPPIYTTFNALIANPVDPAGTPQVVVALRPDGRSEPQTVRIDLGRDRHLGALPAAPAGLEARYQVVAGPGEVLASGDWQPPVGVDLLWPEGVAEARLELQFNRANAVVGVPLTAVGNGEVFVVEPGQSTPCVGWRSLWFKVPAGVDSFKVVACGPWAEIVDPDGVVVWRAAEGTTPAVIAAPPLTQDRLWQAVIPGHLQLGAAIPPAFAVEPDRWFLPESD